MIKRLLKVVLFIPAAFAQTFIQVPYLTIKWVITGKWVEDPWVLKLIEW